MNQSGKGLNHKVKAMAMETFWVLEVIFCWVVALPILLFVFFGLILWEEIEKMRLAQSRHLSGTDLPLRSSRHIETRSSSSNLRQIRDDLRNDYIRHGPAYPLPHVSSHAKIYAASFDVAESFESFFDYSGFFVGILSPLAAF
jgi:hypothetical protein